MCILLVQLQIWLQLQMVSFDFIQICYINDCTLAWKDGIGSVAPEVKKRKKVATKNLLQFRAKETFYMVNNPEESSTGKWVSSSAETIYAISPWVSNELRTGWLGEGSIKFAVIVSFPLQ